MKLFLILSFFLFSISTFAQQKKWMLSPVNKHNSTENGDKTMVPYNYTVGQIMLDSKCPSSILHRCTNYFLRSERNDETTGQMSYTMFVEAMCILKGNG